MVQTSTLRNFKYENYQKINGLTRLAGNPERKEGPKSCLCPGGFSSWEKAAERLSCGFEGLQGLGARGTKNWNLGTAKDRDAGKDPLGLGTPKDESGVNQSSYSAA